ncbi:MAG: energy transducer TonB [Sphingobium phenoxybenzoativorans]|uniref:energy transducer TonB n=1 Tax=Sphingobium phenoxybenzoativorans TaxID=1592790 RepID=UPI0008730470|nr:energy transducer TonB [Sphingobium phenoxybenzoativorans]
MIDVQPATRDRIAAALAVAVLHAALGFALLFGLRVDAPLRISEELKIFGVPPEPAPPPKEPRKPASRHESLRPEGAASPPNLKARPTQIAAPPPVLPVLVPPLVIAAPVPGVGNDASAGNAAVRGPGTGSGGTGTGTGSGDDGFGDGDGGNSPPRWIRGRIKDSDYPKAEAEAGVGGTVSVRYTVETTGRATGCTVTQSSGSADLDAVTCRLVEDRFRYRPSMTPQGRAVRSIIVENHHWVIDREQASAPEE